MKVLIAVVVSAVVGAGAVLFGLALPERERRLGVEGRLARADAELSEARALLLVHALFDEVLDLVADTQDLASFDKAQATSTRFFDVVRKEASRTSSAQVRAALAGVLTHRDTVTAALARRDPAVRVTLDEIRRGLHPLLLRPEPEAPAVAPTPPAR
jgi:hypothetical protein